MNQEQKKEARKLPGFYIALCCCVLVIGVAGYFTEAHNNKKASSVISNEVEQTEATETPVFANDKNKYVPPVPTSVPVTSEETTANANSGETNSIPVVSQPQAVEDYAVDNPDVEENAITVSSEQPAFIMPVNGNILEGYSDKLIYNEVLSDWRTHNGIDISAEKGCSVQSVAEGVIESISEDATGGCVVISHAAGFTTKYMGLDNVENLAEGNEINSGEVIGTIGDSKGENTKESHLHFEMAKDNVSVNPIDFLPQE
ncbi:MAG: M23 family metallopeptidase [Clostridia bacterium]|nr:M23 family metallopeptidase [Clostridia bacterium]